MTVRSVKAGVNRDGIVYSYCCCLLLLCPEASVTMAAMWGIRGSRSLVCWSGWPAYWIAHLRWITPAVVLAAYTLEEIA
jgi:hypothetical protein